MKRTKDQCYQEAAGAAAQLVFEYPDFGCEHLEDMYRTWDVSGEKPPVPAGVFDGAVYTALRFKDDGLDYDQVISKTAEALAARNAMVFV